MKADGRSGWAGSRGVRHLALLGWFALFLASPAARAQDAPAPAEPTHDITGVDVAPLHGAIAIPLATEEGKRANGLEVPELAGSRPAIGSQLVDGKLPRPVADYCVTATTVTQRISIFDTGLVVIHISGATGTIRKKMIIPPDALKAIRDRFSPSDLELGGSQPATKETSSEAHLRIYGDDGTPVDLHFDPSFALPKKLEEVRRVMEDLLTAMAEDRDVTSSLTNYEPHLGDRLVGEDEKTYRVSAILQNGALVELTGISEPVRKYFPTRDLHQFFVGTTGTATH